jgi:pimeloyl-ACP methyl ester carboxylesterase
MDNLDGQIKHKKYFINDFVPATVHLVLIGHSIGAYMTLELLQHLPKDRVEKAILLFPTIERMAISPNGKWATPLLTYFQFLPISFAYFSTFLSNEFKVKLIRWYMKGSNIPECVYKATLDLFEPSVVRASMRLAKDEMEKVVDINSEAVLANQDKLIFYYGVTDQWCPVSYYQDTKNRFPEVEAWLCEDGFEHAFILKSSREMAAKVSGWLQEKVLTL